VLWNWNLDGGHLNHLQTGRYGRVLRQYGVVRAGFDVFNAEVDDKGIDFVLRVGGDVPRYYDIQVKTVRSRNTYVLMRKDKFRLTPNLLLALVILDAGSEPEMYLIPASAWRHAKPPFADRDYDGLESAPEYGLTGVALGHGGARTVPFHRKCADLERQRLLVNQLPTSDKRRLRSRLGSR
jgi:hypothetical protein